jgi:hypothetical protein
MTLAALATAILALAFSSLLARAFARATRALRAADMSLPILRLIWFEVRWCGEFRGWWCESDEESRLGLLSALVT